MALYRKGIHSRSAQACTIICAWPFSDSLLFREWDLKAPQSDLSRACMLKNQTRKVARRWIWWYLVLNFLWLCSLRKKRYTVDKGAGREKERCSWVGNSPSNSILVFWSSVYMGKHHKICISVKVIRTFKHLKFNAFIKLSHASTMHFVCLLEMFKKIYWKELLTNSILFILTVSNKAETPDITMHAPSMQFLWFVHACVFKQNIGSLNIFLNITWHFIEITWPFVFRLFHASDFCM